MKMAETIPETVTPEVLPMDAEITGPMLDLRPEMSKACLSFGKEFVNVLIEKEAKVVLKATVAKNNQDLKNSKKQMKKLCHEIASIEKKLERLSGEQQKQMNKLTEIGQHEAQLWNVLNLHVDETSVAMQKFKEIQEELTLETEEDKELEEEAQKLEERINSMGKTLQEMQEWKTKLFDEKNRLEKITSPEYLEEKTKEIQEKKEKLTSFNNSIEEVRRILNENQTSIAKHEIEEKHLQVSIDDTNNQINTSVTEKNNLKLQIEAKGAEAERQLSAVQSKLEKVQNLCDTRTNELKTKLNHEQETLRTEIANILQKNSCLEASHAKRCEDHKSGEAELAKLRASIWEIKEGRKQELIKEVNKNQERLCQKKKLLAKLQLRLKKQQEKKAKEKSSEEPPEKKSKCVFKKPVAPSMQNYRKIKSTNELFSQLMIPSPSSSVSSASPVTLSKSGNLNISTNKWIAQLIATTNDDDDDGQGSDLSMSTIEGLDAMESRLMARDLDSCSQFTI